MMRGQKPGPGQECVWDYPRPPRLEPSDKHIRVEFTGQVIAETRRAFRVLETSHPPTYYLPPQDVRQEFLMSGSQRSYCEFKGDARYYSLQHNGHVSANAAWCYPQPTAPFQAIATCIAFHPSRVDACFVAGERVQAQAGDFSGGWITRDIVGPFKGGPGTGGW